jgi:hypothetical protein
LHGADFVISLQREMVLGRFSFAAFCLFLALMLPYQATLAVFAEAAALAMGVQWCTRHLTQRRDVSAEADEAVACRR